MTRREGHTLAFGQLLRLKLPAWMGAGNSLMWRDCPLDAELDDPPTDDAPPHR